MNNFSKEANYLYQKSKVEYIITWLSKLPLKKLRQRQDLVTQQIKWAMDSDNEFGLNNLRVRERLLVDAIIKREFDD